MQYLGDKLSVAQTQVSGWVGNIRQSLQEAVEFVSGALEREKVTEQQDNEERVGKFERAILPLRSFASRGRQSLRNLSQQSRQRFSLRRHTTTTNSDNGQLQESALEEDEVTEQDLIKEFDNLDEINNTADDLVAESRNVQALQRVKRKSKTDSDPTNAPGQEEPESLHFPESSAPLLDSSVFRSKVDLGKKRSIKRSRPSRAIRQRAALPTLTEGTHPDWRFCDSTDVTAQCSNGGDSESEEEPSKDSTSSPAPSQPKRVPLFPGMDQSALMAQLKRRSGAVETDTPSEGLTTPPVPAHSPCTPTMSLSPRVLPSLDSKDSGSGPSPSWLLELKSKKRASQPESEA